jgi:FKBP-type peptidyl-prolyl cis-trans isomerase FkpA
MIKNYIAWPFVLLMIFGISCTKKKNADSGLELKEEQSKVLYALGLNLGKNLAHFELTGDELRYVLAGIEDEVLARPAKVNWDEYQVKVNALYTERLQKRASSEKDKGTVFVADFLAQNSKARKLEGDLLLLINKLGKGEKATINDTVLIRYTGKLTTGEVFDTTDGRSSPAELPIGRVIKGWQIALQELPVGSKAQLVIPPELAYGDAGAPPHIKPGATLVFDIELVGIKKNQ